MAYNQEDSKRLSDKYKKEGHFDKLKREILSNPWNDTEENSESFEQALRKRVASTVKEMVNEDEELIFKNRGLTSALIESQLVKDNYLKLGSKMEGDNGDGEKKFDLDVYVRSKLQDPKLLEMIKGQLQETLNSYEEEANGST
ncbi:BCN_G0004710.mRNA.1.CDS.1 [Saccharomyces cerevisiae]|nr:BCN_G0004710.mRNA.1.CDS.1 [Saccharomyces cerevisiae]CAI4290079.1 BCE_3a_G0004650.mRNA.1.CDS.1 [Saccharomyces cerevisiae]CAI5237309.1 ALI_HP2_G0004440.mRNA.1.CDS.1 [Saccharomyces cerevisiae]CAI6401021.1 ALI_HP2_G0004440.mRNA.1.CDS.1 [Saccharomyces cerevisiae]CAI6404534.1 ALI_HP1_G0004720.mRNA.1.CDS.1 [Saccharomyces cerevisiae]